MIKKLQSKLILVTMSALFAVLAMIVTGINIVNYYGVVRDADELLQILSENKGVFPEKFGDIRPDALPPDMSMEVPFETRYFSVTLDSATGELVQIDTSRIVSVGRQEALAFAQAVIQGGEDGGFVEAYRYTVRAEATTTRIIFLDCGRKLDSFHSFRSASIAIALLGYMVVFSVVALSSIHIIRPISESYEKQKRFITDAGHELKTPLTVINADVDVLEMELGEDEWLMDIRRQTQRLAALTNDLVYLSRMEESADTLPMIEFPFSDVVSEAAASFGALAQTQNKQIDCSIQPMLSLRGNEKAIQQLVGILLDNALKYSPAGAVISLTLEKQNKALILSVSNVSEYPLVKGELPLLFERFYRADPSRNSQTGGYGIGLSVAKAIVTAHSGRIQAKAEAGNSLKITAAFPV